MFINRQNVTTLAFVVTVVCFRFFLAPACCLNYLSKLHHLGLAVRLLPERHLPHSHRRRSAPRDRLGTSITFILYILGPFFIFLYTLFLVELPFIIGLSLAQDSGVTFGNLWSGSDALHRLLQALLLGGLFLFPAAILTTAVGGSFLMLRPDYLLAPLPRAFFPYLTTVALLTAACVLEMRTAQYDPGAEPQVTVAHLGLNLLVQVVAIIAMRSIGLFYRHYGCYFKW